MLHCPDGTVTKYLPASAGDSREVSWIPGLGRSPEGGNNNPLQYSCWDNPMDRGACGAIQTHTTLCDVS